jgi:HEAT repeat protein
VRIAGIRALGAAANPGGVAVLGKALRSDDKGEILAASEALARIANAEAVEVLGAALRDGSLATAFAAAFALKQTEREAAYAILREQREINPDPQVRRAIKMALGERLDEHED